MSSDTIPADVFAVASDAVALLKERGLIGPPVDQTPDECPRGSGVESKLDQEILAVESRGEWAVRRGMASSKYFHLFSSQHGRIAVFYRLGDAKACAALPALLRYVAAQAEAGDREAQSLLRSAL